MRCKALAGSRLGAATIEEADWVTRGEPLLGLVRRTVIRMKLPSLPDLDAPVDFCRATAKLQPVPGSEITAQVWLPQQWNGKLMGAGGGGFNGGLLAAAITLRDPVKKGYAALATDAGHEVTESAKFAYDSAEKLTDYAWRANHVGAEFAKALASSYYGNPVKRAYFHGCSNGGRDALMLAKRYPGDYDGIIAGAPAAAYTELMTSFLWNRQAAGTAPELGNKLKLVQDAVIAKCDALDGVKDRLLENPLNCPFDPAELQCKGGNGPDCLTPAEIGALRKIYDGPRLRDGTQVYPGQPFGGEGLPMNWEDWIVTDKWEMNKLGPEAYRWMAHRDPQWDASSFDLDRDYPLAKERMGPILDSNDPDLGAFMRRGGRLMLYHGWNDAPIPAGATLDYYTALRKTMGPIADKQARLFMVPGMMHCGGGVGPNTFDMLGEMDRWVESGTAPERVAATEYNPRAFLGPAPDAKVVRTRPLCVWPKAAHYKGSGSSDDAANFICK